MSGDEYTPTVEWVTEAWVKERRSDGVGAEDARAEVSGLLAVVRREAKAEALRGAADRIDVFERGDHSYITDALRAEADRIEKGESA